MILLQTSDYEYALEDFHLFYPHAIELFKEHHREVDLFGASLDIDVQMYRRMQDADALKVFTVREWGRLIGYCAFFLYKHCHHKTSIHAKQDVLFIKKDKRGKGLSFLKYCESQLKNMGVQVIHQSVPCQNDWSKVLEYLKYEKLEITYMRRL